MKRIYAFMLVLTLLLTSIPLNSVLAADFRWINVEILSMDIAYNNSSDQTYHYEDGIYSFRYYIKTDFNYNKNATTILATFSQGQLGDKVAKNSNFSNRKMKIYVNLKDFESNSPNLMVNDFEFLDLTPESYDTTVTLLEYIDYIDNRRVFYAKDLDDNYFYVAFSTRTDKVAPSMYSTDSYLVKFGEVQPYKGKYLYIVTDLDKTTIDRDNEELYNKETQTFSGELKSFFIKDTTKNTISYVFEESSKQKEYIVLFDLNGNSQEYLEITSDLTLEDFEEQLIDEYQEGRKLVISGYIEGSTDYKEIIVVKDFTYLDDNFTRYDKENVFLEAVVTKNISAEIGREIYEISESSTNLLYYAIFDKNVLGNAMPKNKIDGREITVHGITEYKNGKYYIGVLSFNLKNSETSLTDTYNIKEISITSLLSETNEEVVYKGLDNNGKVNAYIFSKGILKNSMPTSSILNKTLNVAYTESSAAEEGQLTLNTILAWTETIKDNQDYAEKGILLERTQNNDTSSVYNFKNSYGEIIQAIIPKEIENNLLQQKGLTKKTDTLKDANVSLFGNISAYETQRRFIVKDANLISELYMNKTTADVFTFNGVIDSVVSQNTSGITYHTKNSYNQYALLYFSKDTLGANYPKTSLLNKNIVVRGLTYSNGIILVTDYNEVTKMNSYPSKIEPLYREPEHYTNMEGLTGVISMLKTESGKTHLTLVTSSARYLLSYKPEMKDTLEANLGNMVYLRGEPHSVGDPVWSMSIDVYDIAPVCFTKGNCETFIKPINTPAPIYQDDGQKQAIHTGQDNGELPENYEYGKAILESLFLPKFVISQEKDFFGK